MTPKADKPTTSAKFFSIGTGPMAINRHRWITQTDDYHFTGWCQLIKLSVRMWDAKHKCNSCECYSVCVLNMPKLKSKVEFANIISNLCKRILGTKPFAGTMLSTLATKAKCKKDFGNLQKSFSIFLCWQVVLVRRKTNISKIDYRHTWVYFKSENYLLLRAFLNFWFSRRQSTHRHLEAHIVTGKLHCSNFAFHLFSNLKSRIQSITKTFSCTHQRAKDEKT